MTFELQLLPYAATAVAALLMLQAGAAKGLVESRLWTRWCAACHRRVVGGRCGCSEGR